MQAYRVMQVVKNGLYRTTGEVVDRLGTPDESTRTLRVLMYHKVNDLWPNPITVPTAVFGEQMTLLGELGYVPVSLDAVRDHYVDGVPLPERAVLITFDDGYRDNLENAFPILAAHGYPAVVFVPIAYLDDSRPLDLRRASGGVERHHALPHHQLDAVLLQLHKGCFEVIHLEGDVMETFTPLFEKLAYR